MLRSAAGIFSATNCSSCHTQPLFSNYKFFNAGVGMDKPNPDEGRKKVTGKDSDMGKFRVAGAAGRGQHCSPTSTTAVQPS